PFTGDPWSVLRRHRHSAIPALPPDVDPELAALTLSLLARRPEDRPASAARVARALGADVEDTRGLHRAGLAGREAERARLAALIDDGGAIVLVGEAGSGKTRLALEAVAEARARDLPVVAGSCAPADGPLGPFLD